PTERRSIHDGTMDGPGAHRPRGSPAGLRHPEADARAEAGRGGSGRAATRARRPQLSVGDRDRFVEWLHPARRAGPVGGRSGTGRVHGRRRRLQPAHDVRRHVPGGYGYLLRRQSRRAVPAVAADRLIGVRWSVPVLDRLSLDFVGGVRYWLPWSPLPSIQPYLGLGYRLAAFERD